MAYHYIHDAFIEDELEVGSFVRRPTVTSSTLNGTYVMPSNATSAHIIEGTATGFSLRLPDATSEDLVHEFIIINRNSQNISLRDFSGNLLVTISQTSVCYAYLLENGTPEGEWATWQVLINEASGIANYRLISSTPFTTSSRDPTFAAITGFTLTPIAGKYACFYNASVFYTTTPKFHKWAFYRAGVQVTDSLRQQDTAHSDQTMVDSTMTIIDCDGTQAIDVRVSCANTGSLTVNARTMLLIRLGSNV